MAGLSDYSALKILDKLLRNVDFTVADQHISLHTADPGVAGGSEVTAGGFTYARQNATFAVAAARATTTTALLEWLNMPAVTVTHVGVWDAATAGNFIIGGALAASKTVNAGDTFQLPTGDLDASIP